MKRGAHVRNPKRNPEFIRRSSKNLKEEMMKTRLYKDFPLRGNWSAIGLYYMTIDVGTSQQTFHVQVDTGSSDLGIPDVGCKCGHHLDKYWDAKKDSSASKASCHQKPLICSGDGAQCKDSQCAYTISYEDGSGYSAHIYNDTVVFGSVANQGIHLKSQYVGAIVSEQTPNGPFEPYKVDGIAGFAQEFLSVVNAPTMIDELTNQYGSSCPKIFSMCGDTSMNPGVLTVCGMGNHHTGNVQWTPMTQFEQGFYNIYTVDMAVNGERLGVPSKDYNEGLTTIDSGTTAAYIPNKAMNKIKELIMKNCTHNNLRGVCDVSKDKTVFDGYCFEMTQAEASKYPTIQLIAGESNPITIDFPWNSYIVPGFCSNNAHYSSSFTAGGPTGSGTLFGDPIMLAQEVVYDVENKRMGFAPKSNCLYSSK